MLKYNDVIKFIESKGFSKCSVLTEDYKNKKTIISLPVDASYVNTQRVSIDSLRDFHIRGIYPFYLPWPQNKLQLLYIMKAAKELETKKGYEKYCEGLDQGRKIAISSYPASLEYAFNNKRINIL